MKGYDMTRKKLSLENSKKNAVLRNLLTDMRDRVMSSTKDKSMGRIYDRILDKLYDNADRVILDAAEIEITRNAIKCAMCDSKNMENHAIFDEMYKQLTMTRKEYQEYLASRT